MNIPSTRSLRRLGATLIAGLLASTAFPQGSLTPPAGVPGPTQKTLQQIWDKIDALETQARGLQDQVGTLQNDNAALGLLLDNAGVALPWRNTVATNTLVTISATATNSNYRAGSLSLAISPLGIPAISWSEGAKYAYATEEGARWKSSKWSAFEGTSSDVFEVRSGGLGFLPSGQAVLLGTVATNLVLKALTGGATNMWVIPMSTPQTFHQLAITSESRPEISYLGTATNALKILQWAGGGWTNTVVATNVGYELQSMAVSSSRETGITYVAPGTYHLRYAFQTSQGWTNTLVAANATYLHSLAFNSTNNPTVCFWSSDGPGFDLKLATRSGGGGGLGTGSWNIEDIETGLVTGSDLRVSLAFAPNGRPAVAYSEPRLGVRYATQSPTGTWTITQVAPPDPTPNRGFDSVLRFTRSGYPVIVYWDEETNTIRVATRAPFVAP